MLCAACHPSCCMAYAMWQVRWLFAANTSHAKLARVACCMLHDTWHVVFCMTRGSLDCRKPRGMLYGAVNKQLNDKERVAAAIENGRLLDVVNKCLAGVPYDVGG